MKPLKTTLVTNNEFQDFFAISSHNSTRANQIKLTASRLKSLGLNKAATNVGLFARRPQTKRESQKPREILQMNVKLGDSSAKVSIKRKSVVPPLSPSPLRSELNEPSINNVKLIKPNE